MKGTQPSDPAFSNSVLDFSKPDFSLVFSILSVPSPSPSSPEINLRFYGKYLHEDKNLNGLPQNSFAEDIFTLLQYLLARMIIISP